MVGCFPALYVHCMFRRAWHRLYVFPRLELSASLPALDVGYKLSRVWRRLNVSRLAMILRSPAPLNGSLFFPASRWLRVARAKRGVMQIFSPVFLPPFPTH